MKYTQDFYYFSYDFRKVHVNSNYMAQLQYSTQTELALDVCEQCHGKFTELVKKQYKPSECMPGRNYHKGIHCDMTSTKMVGTYDFYHCVITKADVRMSHKPYICMTCKGTVTDLKQPCPACQGTDFGKKADIVTGERELELWICDEAYDKLKPTKAQLEQRREASQWSSSAE
jgi:hypothetical protein